MKKLKAIALVAIFASSMLYAPSALARKFFGTETSEIGVNGLVCGDGNFGTITTTTTYVFGIAVSTSNDLTCYDGSTGQQLP